MRKECIELLTDGNREIEFAYNNKRYSITYFRENGKKKISFCEFYQEPTDVDTCSELLRIMVDGDTLGNILAKVPDSAFIIH